MRLFLLVLVFVCSSARAADCFVFRELGSARVEVSDAAECATRTSPASTFKVPHALIALETGVVTDPLRPAKWDRSKQPFTLWERNHSLDSAIKWSVFWFFRRTAAQIGRERMTAALKRIGYGTDTFEGELTSFWVNGDLAISAVEQADFLARLFRNEVAAKRENVDAVKAALLMPAGKITNASGIHDFALTWPKDAVVRAKTGNTRVGEERVSWLVGHIEARGRQYVFASRVRSRGAVPGTAGLELALRSLNAR
jgi:beta-lactamase class D